MDGKLTQREAEEKLAIVLLTHIPEHRVEPFLDDLKRANIRFMTRRNGKDVYDVDPQDVFSRRQVLNVLNRYLKETNHSIYIPVAKWFNKNYPKSKKNEKTV